MEEATNLVVERARQLTVQLIEHRGHDRPPFLSEEFAHFKSIRIEVADLGKIDALLLRLSDGYVIRVNNNKDHSASRQNFSCAHEIGHVILSELKPERPKGDIEYRTLNPQADVMKARERLCQAAAKELLMPEVIFQKYVSDLGISIQSLERLANIFKVSIQTAAIRIAEVSGEPCVVLLWHLRRRSKTRALQLAWRVGPGRSPCSKGNYMPVNNVIRNDSVLFRAYEYDTPVTSCKPMKVDTVKKRCPMESKGFGRGENRFVLSLAFPDR